MPLFRHQHTHAHNHKQKIITRDFSVPLHFSVKHTQPEEDPEGGKRLAGPVIPQPLIQSYCSLDPVYIFTRLMVCSGQKQHFSKL